MAVKKVPNWDFLIVSLLPPNISLSLSLSLSYTCTPCCFYLCPASLIAIFLWRTDQKGSEELLLFSLLGLLNLIPSCLVLLTLFLSMWHKLLSPALFLSAHIFTLLLHTLMFSSLFRSHFVGWILDIMGEGNCSTKMNINFAWVNKGELYISINSLQKKNKITCIRPCLKFGFDLHKYSDGNREPE